MKKNLTVLHFLCYSPQIYSGLDRFTILLAVELKKKGYDSVFIYTDKINPKALITDIENIGCNIEIISKPSLNFKTVKQTLKLLLKYKPAIVHIHFDPAIKLIAAIQCRLLGISVYMSNHVLMTNISVHDFIEKNGILRLYRLRTHLKIFLSLANKLFCVSQAVKREYENYSGSLSEKLQLLYLGVNCNERREDKFNIRKKYNLPSNKILIVNVSAIEYIKGIDIIIKALKILKDSGMNNLCFIHIGGIRAYETQFIQAETELKQLANVHLIQDEEIIWLGKRMNVIEILSACDIYTHPSRTEGLPTAIMEAGSASLPIVATRVGGIPEIVQHNINGFLIDSENEFQLAEALYKLSLDSQLRFEMGKSSYDIINKNWNVTAQVQKLIKAYKV